MTRDGDNRSRSRGEPGDEASGNGPSPLLGASRGASSNGTIYTWTCPYCGTSRSKVVSERAPAEHALKLHVLNSEGKGHEQRNSYPPTLDTDALDQYVTRSDG